MTEVDGDLLQNVKKQPKLEKFQFSGKPWVPKVDLKDVTDAFFKLKTKF